MNPATGGTGSEGAPGQDTEAFSATSLKAAQLIAASPTTIRLHTGDNNYGDSAPWPDTAPVRPWTVYPATVDGHFRSLAIDLDASKGDAADEAELIIAEMRREGLKAVLVCSGPSGGRHIFATFDVLMPEKVVDEIKRRLVARLPTIDPTCMATTITIRPPGAPHRNGGHSTPLDPADPDEMLAILAEGNPPSAVRSYLEALGVPRWWADVAVPSGLTIEQMISLLSPNGRQLLKTGRKKTGDTTRSGVQYTFLMSARAAGLDFSDCYWLLSDPNNRAGERFRESTGRDSIAQLHREWLKICDQMTDAIRDKADARSRILAFEEELKHHDWSGQAGNTDRRVIAAVIKIALEAGTITPRRSTRQIALDAMVRPTTVSNSWKRLEERRGLITILEKGSRDQGTLIQLNIDSKDRDIDTTDTIGGGVLPNVTISGHALRDSLHESFQVAGLSPSAHLVYSALSVSEATSAVQVVLATCKGRSTVYNALSDLSDYGLACSNGDGKWLRVERDLDDVAKDLGVDGSRDRREIRHAFERDNYHWKVTEFQEYITEDGRKCWRSVTRRNTKN